MEWKSFLSGDHLRPMGFVIGLVVCALSMQGCLSEVTYTDLYRMPDGATYSGQVKRVGGRLIRDGQGVYAWASRDEYEGQWKDDVPSGQGTFTTYDGAVYDGEWREGRFHGKGTYRWPDDSSYTGEFRNGVKSGRGVLRWADGRVYEGDFRADVKSGTGIYRWKDNRIYQGDFVDGRRSGGLIVGKIQMRRCLMEELISFSIVMLMDCMM